MRALLGEITTTWWSDISVAIFFVLFLGLVAWVFSPSRRKKYEEFGGMPCHDEDHTQIKRTQQ